MTSFIVKCTLAGLLIGGSAFKLGTTFSKTNVVSKIDTVHVDRPIQVRDTINILQPYQVTVFDTVQTLRVDTIRVASDFAYTGVVSSNPITLDRSGFTLTRFDLERQSFVQSHYKLPTPKWSFGVFSSTTLTNQSTRFGFESDIRYKDVTVTPLLGIENVNANLQLFYGARLKYRLF